LLSGDLCFLSYPIEHAALRKFRPVGFVLAYQLHSST
jgi:hypothetical protein